MISFVPVKANLGNVMTLHSFKWEQFLDMARPNAVMLQQER